MQEELNLKRVIGANDSENFRLRWDTTKDRFRFSDSLFSRLGLDNNGLTIYENENDVFLGVEPEETASFATTKKGAKSKGRDFKVAKLGRFLRDYEFPKISDTGYIYLDLEYKGDMEIQGNQVQIYKIVLDKNKFKDTEEENTEKEERNLYTESQSQNGTTEEEPDQSTIFSQ